MATLKWSLGNDLTFHVHFTLDTGALQQDRQLKLIQQIQE